MRACSTRSGCKARASTGCSAETLPALAALGLPRLGLGRRLLRRRLRRHLRAPRRARRCRGDRAQPLVPERRGGARDPRPRSSPPAAPRTSKPLYAKLSPATWDIAESARAVVAAGADGLSLVNTIRGMALDPHTLRPKLGRGTGGYSGPALQADRARVRLRVRPSGRRADRRDGRSARRARRARARRGGCKRCLIGHRPLRRSGVLRLASRRAARAKPRRAGSQIRSTPGELPMVSWKKSLQIGENSSA